MENKLDSRITWLIAFCLGAFSCVTRLSIAVGSILQGIAVLCGVILLWRQRNSVQLNKETKGYMAAAGIFFLCTLPSALFAGHAEEGLGQFLDMWVWRYMIFLLIVLFVRKRTYLTNMLFAFLLFFGADSLLTFIQVYILHLTDRGWGFGSNMLAIAGIMCMVLPLCFVVLFDQRFDRKLKYASVWTMLSIFVGLLSNKSRAAWLTCLITTPVVTGKYIRDNIKYLAVVGAIMIGFCGFFFANPSYISRFKSVTNTTTNTSNTDRLQMWQGCLTMYKNHPVIGVGLGRFKPEYKEYAKSHPEIVRTYSHAHNNFMHLLAETGTIGIAGYLIFIFYSLVHSLRSWLKSKSPYDLLIFTTILSFMCLFGQVEYIIDNSSAVRLFWFLFAIMLQMKTIKQGKNQKEESGRS